MRRKLETIAVYNGKGGVGKSTVTPIIAAAIKKIFPLLKVGVIAADTDQRSLAWSYTPDFEWQHKGIWNAIATKLDPRTASNLELYEDAIRNCVRKIHVIPSWEGDDGCIEFMSCAGELGKGFQTSYPMGTPESYRMVGDPMLDDIGRLLGWDIAMLDLPGAIRDSLVMALLPTCTSVVVISDCQKAENLSMETDVVNQLKASGIKVTGFLANKVDEKSAAGKDAFDELVRIQIATDVPVIAQVRHMPTLMTSNRPFTADGKPVMPSARWQLPEGGLHMGLYRIMEGAGRQKPSPSVAKVTKTAIEEIERVAVTIMENSFLKDEEFRAELEKAKKMIMERDGEQNA
ncbi:MAG: ParA family protein [Holophagales bacterium]|jgi:cellulose biosynthesis protein BcsQ|nr:ParA family protein [Holophagales bacterium]